MTIQEFALSIDSTTQEKIILFADSEELKESFGGKLRVYLKLFKTLQGAKVENVSATENALMLTLSKAGKVYLLDGCKCGNHFGVTLAEMIPPAPLELEH